MATQVSATIRQAKLDDVPAITDIYNEAVLNSDASLHLAKQVGFVHLGTMKEVGRKFGRLLDVHMVPLLLNPDISRSS